MNKTPLLRLNKEEIRQYLMALSADDFKSLGAEQIAYIREVDFMGQKRFVVYRGDGQQLSVMEDENRAFASVKTNDMDIVTLQ